MTLQPIKDVSEYKRLKQTLRDRFESEKTGDQSLLEEQTKKYKPLLTSQQEISKTMQDVANQIVESQKRRTSCTAAFVTAITEYTKSTTSSSRSTRTTSVSYGYVSITVRHSSNIPDGACIRSRFHITHTHSNWPGFVSQRYN